MNSRVVKPQLPPRLIVTAALVGLFVIGFIVFAIWYSGEGIKQAKKSGLVVTKEFVPMTEQQITIGGQAGVKSREKDGEYILTVDVPQADGTKKAYTVWVAKALYERIQVGDGFDVGPYIVPDKK